MNYLKRNGTDVLHKFCPSCKLLLERDRFCLVRSRYDGVCSICKACASLAYKRRKEKHAAATKRWALAHPEQMKSSSEKWKKENHSKLKEVWARWSKKHPHLAAAKAAKRRAVSSRATPAWANQFFIEEIYHLAQLRTMALKTPHHVDHIVPLQHPLVCGLHVEHNLQVIPAALNISKHNKWWPGMP